MFVNEEILRDRRYYATSSRFEHLYFIVPIYAFTSTTLPAHKIMPSIHCYTCIVWLHTRSSHASVAIHKRTNEQKQEPAVMVRGLHVGISKRSAS